MEAGDDDGNNYNYNGNDYYNYNSDDDNTDDEDDDVDSSGVDDAVGDSVGAVGVDGAGLGGGGGGGRGRGFSAVDGGGEEPPPAPPMLDPVRCFPSTMIIGAQKSGTTVLLSYLINHPQFRGPRMKEVCVCGVCVCARVCV
jgi:hypothetical protein